MLFPFYSEATRSPKSGVSELSCEGTGSEHSALQAMWSLSEPVNSATVAQRA